MSNKQVANSKSLLAVLLLNNNNNAKRKHFTTLDRKSDWTGFSAGIRELAHVFIIIMFFSPKDSLYLCMPSLYYDEKTII
jgi:hypothetical protein